MHLRRITKLALAAAVVLALNVDLTARAEQPEEIHKLGLSAGTDVPLMVGGELEWAPTRWFVPSFGVGYLPGAILVRPDSAPEALEARLPRGARVVAYCGLGYRSSSLLERTGQARSDLQLHNLEGSIFKWALEGRPLVRGDAAARVIHPFSPRWAKTLLPAERLSTR